MKDRYAKLVLPKGKQKSLPCHGVVELGAGNLEARSDGE